MLLSFILLFSSTFEPQLDSRSDPLPFEWVFVRIRSAGSADEIQVIDKSSIDRSERENVTFRSAIVYEESKGDVSYVTTLFVANCLSGVVRITSAKLHGDDGRVLRKTENEFYEGNMDDTPAGRRLLEAVCNDVWPEWSFSFGGLDLPAIPLFWKMIQ